MTSSQKVGCHVPLGCAPTWAKHILGGSALLTCEKQSTSSPWTPMREMENATKRRWFHYDGDHNTWINWNATTVEYDVEGVFPHIQWRRPFMQNEGFVLTVQEWFAPSKKNVYRSCMTCTSTCKLMSQFSSWIQESQDVPILTMSSVSILPKHTIKLWKSSRMSRMNEANFALNSPMNKHNQLSSGNTILHGPAFILGQVSTQCKLKSVLAWSLPFGAESYGTGALPRVIHQPKGSHKHNQHNTSCFVRGWEGDRLRGSEKYIHESRDTEHTEQPKPYTVAGSCVHNKSIYVYFWVRTNACKNLRVCIHERAHQIAGMCSRRRKVAV